MLHPLGALMTTGESERKFLKRKKWPCNRKTSRHLQVWWRVLFFKTWHCKNTPVSRSHCNDEKTKKYVFSSDFKIHTNLLKWK